MNEKLIEKKLREQVKRLGGIALKFLSPGNDSMPDRIVLMPGKGMWFVEVKTTGKKPRPKQEIMFAFLARLGFTVEVLDDQKKLDGFLNQLEK